MKVKVLTFDGKASSDLELNDNIFGMEKPRIDIIARVVEWQRAKAQSGNHKVKERGEVIGSTKKPFKQKGTGNARRGDNKAPHHRSGGVAHGPRVRSHETKLPKKIKQLGLKSALSQKLKEGNLIIVKDVILKDMKTKLLADNFSKLKIDSALIIDANVIENNLSKAVTNIPKTDALPSVGANVYDIIKHDKLILTVGAVKALEERLAA